MSARTKFYLDRQNRKFMGVCAGLADYTGIDVTWVRVATVLLTIATGWGALGYFVIAFIAKPKPVGLYDTPEDERFWQGVRSSPRRSTHEVRSKFRDIDRRLADIEMFYTSRNTRLAEEIDSLR
ncbi:envelope stress response membrane protein PspC [Sphingomonas sp. RS6]